MTDLGAPLDERKLDLIRVFLRTHFPGSELIDRFDVTATAQRFTLDPGRTSKHTLLVPRTTLEDTGFASLLTQRLVEVLKLAGTRPVTLTAKGIRY
jgi:hypothetical protein